MDQGRQGGGGADPVGVVAVHLNEEVAGRRIGPGLVESGCFLAQIVEQGALEPTQEVELAADPVVRFRKDFVAGADDDGGEQLLDGGDRPTQLERRSGRTLETARRCIELHGNTDKVALHGQAGGHVAPGRRPLDEPFSAQPGQRLANRRGRELQPSGLILNDDRRARSESARKEALSQGRQSLGEGVAVTRHLPCSTFPAPPRSASNPSARHRPP